MVSDRKKVLLTYVQDSTLYNTFISFFFLESYILNGR